MSLQVGYLQALLIFQIRKEKINPISFIMSFKGIERKSKIYFIAK